MYAKSDPFRLTTRWAVRCTMRVMTEPGAGMPQSARHHDQERSPHYSAALGLLLLTISVHSCTGGSRPEVIGGTGDAASVDATTGAAETTAEDVVTQAEPHALLFAYFEAQGLEPGDGLHLVWSEDGYDFQALNAGEVVFKPDEGQSFRDPHITVGPDGVLHMVWTAATRSIGYTSSSDLINWTEPRLLPVMEHEPEAPKFIYLTSAEHVEGPWTAPGEPITRALTEGPSVVRVGDRWHLYADFYLLDSTPYQLYTSKDLETWQDESDALQIPEAARHGTALWIPTRLLEGLISEGSRAR